MLPRNKETIFENNVAIISTGLFIVCSIEIWCDFLIYKLDDMLELSLCCAGEKNYYHFVWSSQDNSLTVTIRPHKV